MKPMKEQIQQAYDSLADESLHPEVWAAKVDTALTMRDAVEYKRLTGRDLPWRMTRQQLFDLFTPRSPQCEPLAPPTNPGGMIGVSHGSVTDDSMMPLLFRQVYGRPGKYLPHQSLRECRRRNLRECRRGAPRLQHSGVHSDDRPCDRADNSEASYSAPTAPVVHSRCGDDVTGVEPSSVGGEV